MEAPAAIPTDSANSFLVLLAESPRMAVMDWVGVSCPSLGSGLSEGGQVPQRRVRELRPKTREGMLGRQTTGVRAGDKV